MKKRLLIIPARKGSKRIKNKNRKIFFGKPIIEYAITTALKSKIFNCIHVSTDCKIIKKISRKYNLNTEFDRPKNLSDDKTKLLKVFDYVVKKFKAKKTKTLVRNLIPVQKEIRKSSTRYIIDMEIHKKYMNHKTFKTSSILNGTFLTINVNGKIYILDGHHRWSAMKRIYPDEKVDTFEIKSQDVRKTIAQLHKLNYVYTERITGQSFL